MSLVAYDASSDEESDYESENAPRAVMVEKPATSKEPNNHVTSNGQISDEEDEFIPQINVNATTPISSLSKILPLPKENTSLAIVIENFSKPRFTALPSPKDNSGPLDIEEEDDEFLHKKPSEEIIEKPQISIEGRKMPVKISIPSLRNFQDVDKEMAEKAKNKIASVQTKSQKSSGLLNILPKAKSEQNFAKLSTGSDCAMIPSHSSSTVTHAFVPDAVKFRRPATNTEDIDRIKINKSKMSNQSNNKTFLNKNLESDESDSEEHDSGDFFSFNTNQSLPEVSSSEINALVAKKASKIAETSTKYLNETEAYKAEELGRNEADEQQLENSRKRYHQEHQLNPKALEALVGGSLKRRRQQNDIQVIDINSEQVLPNKEEWMRTALLSSTTYQPTGVLVDEEPASGTRRKHQITYLAHKAKANEAELQAMWSANRQNRRATQSKYGF